MAPIQVFVYMDIGCVRNDSGNFTEVCLLAVPRNQILQPQNIEDPQDKLTLDLRSSGFDMDVFKQINDFINRQKTPVCLVCHNGHRFDFIVLKEELQKLNVSLSDDLLCADSIYAFYDILKEKHRITDNGDELLLEFESNKLNNNSYELNKKPVTEQETSKNENQPNQNEETCHNITEEQSNNGDLIEEEFITPSSSINVNRTYETDDLASIANIDAVKKDNLVESKEEPTNEHLINGCSIQQQNEKTPNKRKLDTTSVHFNKRQKIESNSLNTSNTESAKKKLDFNDEKHHVYNGRAFRRFFFDNDRTPNESYKLGDIYKRIVKYPPVKPHPVEFDVYMLIRISQKLGKRFLDWTDQIQYKFSDVINPGNKIVFQD